MADITEELVTNEDVFKMIDETRELQTINKNAPTIPEPYIIKGNWLYYRKVTEYTQKEDKLKIFILLVRRLILHNATEISNQKNFIIY
ncbi:hypothetical protein [Staphylococcus pseudoxylosus]|uniref:hypothetical protein n=1 Tax=Staphylococcus pseudoxylosus TaxID=2282419 RepID=UPI00390680B7